MATTAQVNHHPVCLCLQCTSDAGSGVIEALNYNKFDVHCYVMFVEFDGKRWYVHYGRRVMGDNTEVTTGRIRLSEWNGLCRDNNKKGDRRL